MYISILLATVIWLSTRGVIRNVETDAYLAQGYDNRKWIGSIFVLLTSLQTGLQIKHVLDDLDYSTIFALITWIATTLCAIQQYWKYLRNSCSLYYGLFSWTILAFVIGCLTENIYTLYFNFFERTNWHKPMWNSQYVLFYLELAFNAVSFILLIVVHDLPVTTEYSLVLPEELENATRNAPPEIGSSIISNLLFNWVSNSLKTIRHRQPELDDLFEVPRKYSPHYNLNHFKVSTNADHSLAWRLIIAYKLEILGHFVFSLSNVVLLYVQPFLMQQVIKFIEEYLQDPSIGLRYGVFLSICMISSSLAGAIITEQQYMHMRTLSWKVRNVTLLLLTQQTLNRSSKEIVGKKINIARGRTYNVLTADIAELVNISFWVHAVFTLPFRLIIGAWFIYRLLGITGIAGAILMACAIMFTQHLVKQSGELQKKQSSLNDQRLAILTDLFNGIKSVKLFGWTTHLTRLVNEKRLKQLDVLWHKFKLACFIHLSTLGPLPFINFFMLAAYSLQHKLTPDIVFTAVSVFMIIRTSIGYYVNNISKVITVMVSFRRIEAYLNEAGAQPLQERVSGVSNSTSVGFSHATLTWSSGSFALNNLNIQFPEGKLSLVGGPTGSGKSSLLSALVGEMTLTAGHINIPTIYDNDTLVLDNVAYISQEAWLRNATIRDNILFGEPYNQDRYQKVLFACALEPDLNILAAGDMTEIGERGITLSGGQKQRVALARAVYSSKKILLIDDCLSAVDSHTAKHILHHCLLDNTDLMLNRTRVLVTHHMAICLPYSQLVVLMSKGKIVYQGPPQDIPEAANIEMPKDRAEHILTKSTYSSKTATNSPLSSNGKIIKDEIRVKGMVKTNIWKLYFAPSGGWLFILSGVAGSAIARMLDMYKDYFLAAKIETGSQILYWLSIYLVISLLAVLASTFTLLLVYSGGYKSSVDIHDKLLHSLVHAMPRFLDTTPIGRIMTRFSKDIQVIDQNMSPIVFKLMRDTVVILGTLLAISFTLPMFTIVLFGMVVFYITYARIFVKAQTELKRLEGTSFAPLVSLYSEIIPGSDTIRAFGMQQSYMDEMLKRYSVFFKADYIMRATFRWLGIRLAISSSLVTFTTLMFILYRIDSFTSGLAGFLLIYAVNFSFESETLVRYCNEMEISMNGVERVYQYIEIEQESDTVKPFAVDIPTDWPRTGNLSVKDLVVGYTRDVRVLHGISFDVRHGEKIGVVGRTGAGKSSLSLALLRFLESTSGSIKLDGIDIASVPLEQLRQSVTIIPQDPVLFNGTIKFNLDPAGTQSDELLLDALRRTLLLKDTSSVGVFNSLDDMILSNGKNLSLGQRQLVALARALVRRSRLVILDEATASVDSQTDQSMQQAIHGQEFADSTLLCIAHRLQTIIDYDRVLVLDNGKVAEFDTPQSLIQRPDGLFRMLCQKSGEYEYLASSLFH